MNIYIYATNYAIGIYQSVDALRRRCKKNIYRVHVLLSCFCLR